MERYAQITGGIVANVIESAFDPDGINGEWIACGNAGPGWIYNNGVFSEPIIEEKPEDWFIDVGPFKDRLGMDALAIACSSHDACKATKEMLYDRKYIDLKDARISSMLDILIATNQPSPNPIFPGSGPITLEKKKIILSTKPTEAEKHIKSN